MKRLHDGETLDDAIRHVTGARFVDGEDFGSRCIADDEETLIFATELLNYFAKLSKEKGYMVSGSLLLGLDTNCLDFLDWDQTATSPHYQITQMSAVTSDVTNEYLKSSGTSSVFNVEAYRNGITYEITVDSTQQEEGLPFAFTVTRSQDNETTLQHVTAVEIDGTVVDYTYEEGRFLIDAAIFDCYEDGKHKLTLTFDDVRCMTIPFVKARHETP